MSAIADVEYYFQLRFEDTVHTLTLVSMFSPPDQDLLKLSQRAVYICHHGEPCDLTVMDIKAIKAVVAMVPDFQVTVDGDVIIPKNTYSLVESPFLRLAALYGAHGEDDDGIGNDTDTVG